MNDLINKSQDLRVDNIRIGWKMVALSIVSLIGMIVILGIAISSNTKSLYHQKKAQTERLVQVGTGIIQYFYSLESSGSLSRAEAQQYVINSLSGIQFGNSEYFWLSNSTGTLLLNPSDSNLKEKSKSVEGLSLELFNRYVKVAKSGGGWVQYPLAKSPGKKERRYTRFSYVNYFKEWDWILGAGVYLDDMEFVTKESKMRGILFVGLVFIVTSLLSVLIANGFIRKLQMVAIHDPLTKLFTRRYLFELVPLFMAHFERYKFQYLSVIYFNIDHFKMINDVYGRECGDRVLSGIGNIIKNSIRKSDLGVRYGGDEFILLVAANTKEEILIIAERIRALTNNLVLKYNGRDVNVTLSVGISYCARGEAFADLLKRADVNLRKAKKSGRNQLVY